MSFDGVVPNYWRISQKVRRAIKRGDTYYLGVEFYPYNSDDIFYHPETAWFKMSDSDFAWGDYKYRARFRSIPELKKFIGKTFNTLVLEHANVERGSKSGSRFIFDNMLRGMRVAVRLIFPDLTDIEDSDLIWWGRLDHVEDITSQNVKIFCTQEIGDFSYEVATQKYGQGCKLWFGKGECLGYESLEEKSPLMQAAFKFLGQGGCNRTIERCSQFNYTDASGNVHDQTRFYQGQRAVSVQGNFIREEVTKQKFLFFTFHKHKKISVPWSSKNQSENDNKIIPIGFGRTRIEAQAFTWADLGTNINVLQGFVHGESEGLYNITCHNTKLTISNIVQHLGDLGGRGSQMKPGLFPDSGYNSRLTYAEAVYTGSAPTEEAEDPPTTSAIGKLQIVTIPYADGYRKEWTHNPVWITRWLCMNFPFTVVREAWWEEAANWMTANECYEVIEDDTNGDQALITAAEAASFNEGKWVRLASANRVNSKYVTKSNIPLIESEMGGLRPEQISPINDGILTPGDFEWFGGTSTPLLQNPRTYLSFRFTSNGLFRDTISLSDALFSFILPTFRGYISFNHRGKLEIRRRKPADNTFIRSEVPVASLEVPVASVRNFSKTYGYLLIGVGQNAGEIRRIKGIRYTNGFSQAAVAASSTGTLQIGCPDTFVDRDSSPAEVAIDFSGAATIGEQIKLSFTEPDGQKMEWDWFVDDADINTIALMFATRLNASPAFKQMFTAEVAPNVPNRVLIKCQTGYIILDKPLDNAHESGEEVLRVVEVYNDSQDSFYQSRGMSHNVTYPGKDNIKDMTLNVRKQDNYHGVKATYISAIDDFAEKEIQPRIVWDLAEQERSLRLLELDLHFVDNYRQAAWLVKSATIDFVDGNLYSAHTTGMRGLYHEEGDVVAVRHQIMDRVSYTPFTVEELSYSHEQRSTSLGLKLYLSAAFDERVAKVEKFLDTTLTPNPDYQFPPEPVLSEGGFSKTRTGDGAGDKANDTRFTTRKYETFPNQQFYSPDGSDRL